MNSPPEEKPLCRETLSVMLAKFHFYGSLLDRSVKKTFRRDQ